MYGLLIGIGILASVLTAERLAKSREMNLEIFWGVVFWTLVLGIIGARAYHVLDYWEIYSAAPISALFVWNGGLGIFGAIMAGLAAAVVFLRSRGEPLLPWLDIFLASLPLGQGIGRWGNYFNRELLPYSIYESAANLALFAFLFLIFKKHPKPGKITFLYFLGYGAIRFFLEPFRANYNPWQISGFNVAQTISLILVFTAIMGLWKLKSAK